MDLVRRKQVDKLFAGMAIMAETSYICIFDCKTRLLRWSPNAVDIFGLPGEYVDTSVYDWSTHIHRDDRHLHDKTVPLLLAGKQDFYDLRYRIRLKNGEYTLCSVKGMVLKDGEGQPDFITGIVKDHGVLSHTDPVTALPNQYEFFEAVARCKKNGECKSILLMGLSQFSRVNEMYGYHNGNRVLQEVGHLLSSMFSDTGTVFRMDGAKFAVIAQANQNDMTERYTALQRQLRDDFSVDGVRQSISPCASILTVDESQANEKTIYACLSYAYKESKTHRHGALVPFRGDDDEARRQALVRINTIRDCVVDGCKGFYLCYQPIVSVQTERLVAMEALLRWHGAPYGEVPPFQFLPVLENDPLFVELGVWILRQAMSDGVKFLRAFPNVIVNVNLAYIQLEQDGFVRTVVSILEETGFPPDHLCLEITESCRLLDMQRLHAIVTTLRETGVRFAIDDFGTGFASIDILKKLPADVVKIDREFIKDIEASRENEDMVRHMADLASVYGSHVCAEGIENRSMRNILRQFNIDTLQGFLYSKPVPFDEFMQKNFQ